MKLNESDIVTLLVIAVTVVVMSYGVGQVIEYLSTVAAGLCDESTIMCSKQE